ncbi:MAG: Transglutaminase family protein cysteine peptidase [Hyphomicrobiales bacterium]|jgi:predicted transglutaminase-like cysteine proteinase|nr:Transglutaminase family protein cysteine peptidase [Hyphomicrobiales bacterium]
MFFGARQVGIAIVSFFMASAVVLNPAVAEEPGKFISVGASTLTPMGWADFCYRYKTECNAGPMSPRDVDATTSNLNFIDLINRMVNQQVEPKSDADHWNVVDRWDLPTDGLGDCEDYALLKRKILIDAGLPRQALLLTIVRDEMDEGHAVLTVKTTRGDIILDNMNDDIKLWSRTKYRFVKRQSQEDQNVWVNIGAPVETARVLVIPVPVTAGRIAHR